MKASAPVEQTLAISRTRRTFKGQLLRVTPHVNYLRNFSHIKWEPEILGLEEVGSAQISTLVAAPRWAWEWLKTVECVKDNRWDISLLSRSSFLNRSIWNNPAEKPAFMKVSENFTRQGSFINCWSDEGKTHIICGKIDPTDARSILCFVWLQNVLGGGKQWGRRELGMLPEDFSRRLPISYTSFSKPADPLINFSVGLPPPIIQLQDGTLLHTGDWIKAPRIIEKTILSQVHSLIFPGEPTAERELRTFSLDTPQTANGAFWNLNRSTIPTLLAFYPSCLGSRIDHIQNEWKSWLIENAPGLSPDRHIEVLLCLREATLNADHHGCGRKPDKKILLAIQNISRERRLKIRVSDPGKGHIKQPAKAAGDKRQHLGLTLIQGLADRVHFARSGSTIEFDFNF